ncbi:MAG TPA: RNA 2',3'-cyclic phosphodiesterase [Sphingobium sp.]|nr:RNA 2',3'-cyclic phosphodiesterase [Sphingobium sp.]
MHRLFIAVRPPEEIRHQLLALMGGVAGARWQDDAQLHLTLRFVGEVDSHRADDLADALSMIRFDPFPIALAGLGRFERKGHVDTLWASVQPRDRLAQLHRKVDRACVSVGLPADERAYLPHITLARLNRGAGSTEAFMARHAGLASAPFLVDSFALFESRLSPSGAHYHMVVVYHGDEGAIRPSPPQGL